MRFEAFRDNLEHSPTLFRTALLPKLFDFGGDRPGYLELAVNIISAIESGRLPPNSQIPPSRSLAASLGVSRDTVARCYRHLADLGWLKSNGKRGTLVADVFSAKPPPATSPAAPEITADHLSKFGALMLSSGHKQASSIDLTMIGAAPLQTLPVRQWKRASNDIDLLSEHYEAYHSAVLGCPELRTAVSSHFRKSRGIECSSDDVVVFNIVFSALSLVSRILLEPGDSIAVEDPCYAGIKDVACYLSLNVVRIKLDGEGMSFGDLVTAHKKTRIKLVYVSPNNQEPTGVLMSEERRRQIVEWAIREHVFIFEDDYDGHFSYGTKLIPSLRSMGPNNVIYLGGFWQILYPLSTATFALIPASLQSVVQTAMMSSAHLTERTPQLILAQLLQEGFLRKHVRKLENLFAERRRAVIYALKLTFGSKVIVPSHTGGITVMVRFLEHNDESILGAAKSAGLPIGLTSSFYFDDAVRPEGEVLVWFAGIEASEAGRLVSSFASALG